eukprot:scaffold270272_cov23-Tisochrysis_lutea.AAC.1
MGCAPVGRADGAERSPRLARRGGCAAGRWHTSEHPPRAVEAHAQPLHRARFGAGGADSGRVTCRARGPRAARALGRDPPRRLPLFGWRGGSTRPAARDRRCRRCGRRATERWPAAQDARLRIGACHLVGESGRRGTEPPEERGECGVVEEHERGHRRHPVDPCVAAGREQAELEDEADPEGGEARGADWQEEREREDELGEERECRLGAVRGWRQRVHQPREGRGHRLRGVLGHSGAEHQPEEVPAAAPQDGRGRREQPRQRGCRRPLGAQEDAEEAHLERGPLPAVAEQHGRAEIDEGEVEEPERGRQRRPEREPRAAEQEQQREQQPAVRDKLERAVTQLARVARAQRVQGGRRPAEGAIGREETGRPVQRAPVRRGAREGGDVHGSHPSEERDPREPEAAPRPLSRPPRGPLGRRERGRRCGVWSSV